MHFGGGHMWCYIISGRGDYSSWGKNMVKPARNCGEGLDHSPASRWFLKVKLSANWWIIVARMAYDGWWMECCSEELWWTVWLAEQGFAFVSLTLFGPFGLEGPFAAWHNPVCLPQRHRAFAPQVRLSWLLGVNLKAAFQMHRELPWWRQPWVHVGPCRWGRSPLAMRRAEP